MKIKENFWKIYNCLPVQIILTMVIAYTLFSCGLVLLSWDNPTYTHTVNITVSERQILSSVLIRDYYVVTPDNIWYECLEYNNTYTMMQPGHTYNVIMRSSSPRTWMQSSNYTKEQSEQMQELDSSTNIYSNDMIIGVNYEVKNA